MAEDVKGQLLRYLNDAYAAEVGGLASLRDLAAETTDSDVKQAVNDHITVTQSPSGPGECPHPSAGRGQVGAERHPQRVSLRRPAAR